MAVKEEIYRTKCSGVIAEIIRKPKFVRHKYLNSGKEPWNGAVAMTADEAIELGLKLMKAGMKVLEDQANG